MRRVRPARWVLWRRHVPGQLKRLDRLVHLTGREPAVDDDPSRSPAAVAVICVRDPEALLLIRRAERQGDPWSGQMGLPGGRAATGDPDLLATAIRETYEEVGIVLEPTALVGRLDDLAPMTVLLPRVKVRPFVFVLDRPAGIVPNPEVAGAWWVELSEFLRPGVFGSYEVSAGGTVMTRPGYALPQGVVWGMTERILTPFFGRLECER